MFVCVCVEGLEALNYAIQYWEEALDKVEEMDTVVGAPLSLLSS
jgi:hypothetical protein